MISLKVRN